MPANLYHALSRFDVVAFEQRGVGASEPAIDCDELPRPFSRMTPDSFDLPELLRRSQRLARLCLNRVPAFLASLNTGNLARDLDLLRAAVGDPQLSYLGASYGGMIGATYASLFPGRARALVLDSPVDADVWLNRPLEAITEQNVGAEESLDRFFAACAADQATCRFGGDDPERAYDNLLARLDADPLPAGAGTTIDGQALNTVTFEALRSKGNWRPLAAALAGLEGGSQRAARPEQRAARPWRGPFAGRLRELHVGGAPLSATAPDLPRLRRSPVRGRAALRHHVPGRV